MILEERSIGPQPSEQYAYTNNDYGLPAIQTPLNDKVLIKSKQQLVPETMSVHQMQIYAKFEPNRIKIFMQVIDKKQGEIIQESQKMMIFDITEINTNTRKEFIR